MDRELFRNGSGYADPTAYKAIKNYEKGKRKVKRNRNKYRNKKIEIDGIVFDSQKEATRYGELKLLEKAGKIKNLQMQVKYVLIPAQKEPDTIGARGGIHKGKTIEKECAYIADFVYQADGVTIVEDTKGYRTKDYVIKRKLMLYVYGIKIKEV